MKPDPQGPLHPVVKWFRACRFSVAFSLILVKLTVNTNLPFTKRPGPEIKQGVSDCPSEL